MKIKMIIIIILKPELGVDLRQCSDHKLKVLTLNCFFKNHQTDVVLTKFFFKRSQWVFYSSFDQVLLPVDRVMGWPGFLTESSKVTPSSIFFLNSNQSMPPSCW